MISYFSIEDVGINHHGGDYHNMNDKCINGNDHKWVISYDKDERVCCICGIVDKEYEQESSAIYHYTRNRSLDEFDYDHNGMIHPFNSHLTLGSYGAPKRLKHYHQKIKYRSRDTHRHRLLMILDERFRVYGLNHAQLLEFLREIKKENPKRFNFVRGLKTRVIKFLKEKGINEYEGMSIEEFIDLLFSVNL